MLLLKGTGLKMTKTLTETTALPTSFFNSPLSTRFNLMLLKQKNLDFLAPRTEV